MAVTTTVQQILDGAYSKSMKNKPGAIAAESTELLDLVIRSMRGLYAFSARLNPTFFAETQVVPYDGLIGWPRPPEAESVFRIEIQDTSNTPVIPVPFDDRQCERGRPSVYEFGQVYRPTGVPLGPTNEDLLFFYSKRPEDPGDLNDKVDPLWTEQFNELLHLEVAIYLAQKDLGESGRADEIVALKGERDNWLRLLAAFLEHETSNEHRRFGHIRRFNTNWMVPINSLVAGGTSLQFGGNGAR